MEEKRGLMIVTAKERRKGRSSKERFQPRFCCNILTDKRRNNTLYGAILGDIIGSPYEFDRGGKTKDFPLFTKNSSFTDDSVMTVAVADALLKSIGKSDEEIKAALVASMKLWGGLFPYAGYGGMFRRWLASPAPKPYGSYGNGSAMRVSSAGWLY